MKHDIKRRKPDIRNDPSFSTQLIQLPQTCILLYNNSMNSELLQFDKKQALAFNKQFIIGIDEAGRGPLAGPVVACACFLPPEIAMDFCDINDSKKLSAAKREEIFKRLHTSGAIFGIGFASAQEIDKLNILQATFFFMFRAAQKVKNIPHAIALIDGPYPAKNLPLEQTPVIDGDAKSLAIAAASILAKVTRDHYMDQLDKMYPQYAFSAHKGYGTAKHMEALRQFGPCPEHRQTFGPIRKLQQKPTQGDLFLP